MAIGVEQKVPSPERATRWLQVLLGVIAVGITLAALVISLSLRKKELTVIFRGSDSLIEVGGGLETSLSIEYRGKAIRSLSKARIVVRNSGAAPIKAEDVVEPLILAFGESIEAPETGVEVVVIETTEAMETEVLDAVVERTSPPFRFEVGAPASPSSPNTVWCRFALLNPGDEAHIAVYIQGSKVGPPRAFARIVGVNDILVRDESRQTGSPVFQLWGRLGATIFKGVKVYNWIIIGMSSIFLTAGWYYFLKMRSWKSKYETRWNEMMSMGGEAKNEKETLDWAAEFARIPSRPSVSLWDSWSGAFWWNIVLVFLLIFAYFNLGLLVQVSR
ncbi:MAG: hypothetical protein ACE5HL_04490 [Terriglobia bacterium]